MLSPRGARSATAFEADVADLADLADIANVTGPADLTDFANTALVAGTARTLDAKLNLSQLFHCVVQLGDRALKLLGLQIDFRRGRDRCLS